MTQWCLVLRHLLLSSSNFERRSSANECSAFWTLWTFRCANPVWFRDQTTVTICKPKLFWRELRCCVRCHSRFDESLCVVWGSCSAWRTKRFQMWCMHLPVNAAYMSLRKRFAHSCLGAENKHHGNICFDLTSESNFHNISTLLYFSCKDLAHYSFKQAPFKVYTQDLLYDLWFLKTFGKAGQRPGQPFDISDCEQQVSVFLYD